MSNPPRRVPAPNPTSYYVVPQSPRNGGFTAPPQPTYTTRAPRRPNRTPSAGSSQSHLTRPARTPSGGQAQADLRQAQRQAGQRDVARGVATGAIGNAYGPYSYEPIHARDNAAAAYAQQQAAYAQQQEEARAAAAAQYSQYANTQASYVSHAVPADKEEMDMPQTPGLNTSTVPTSMWDPRDQDLDDPLHNPDPVRDAALDHHFVFWSGRGWANASALVVICTGLLLLFAGYPIIAYAQKKHPTVTGFNIGGVNGTGQIPTMPGMRALIDIDTPSQFYNRVGTDGKKYNLVFSDEFNVEGRTFWPGDDPFWEAADLNYWPTGDLEWYDPQAVATKDGKLVITMSELNNHNLNFQSGMLTSWNKFCFTTGYIEVSVSMPGSPQAPGLWPAVWTMGNLGRAGYGATTEGLWPYTYDSCDVGTFPNQTDHNGNPTAAATGGNGGPLSFLPGQRLSACTCPGSDHPGPTVSTGRGAPEIDVFETQIDVSRFQGSVSQSMQAAPYNYEYQFVNTTPAAEIYDDTQTHFNTYKGGIYQQAVSAVTYIDNANYNDSGYAPYAFEWWADPNARDDGYVTWFSNTGKTWTATAAALGPDPISQVSQRIISEEPMYIIFNLGMSPSFQEQDFMHLQFPAKMFIDYVRVYQREDVAGVGCDPKSHPTASYINKHIEAYTNPNLTTWAQANNTFPRNSLYDGCY